jgi:hypothetical protein
LAFFLKGKFTLLVIILVLSSTTILASLLLRVLAVVRGVGSGCGDEGLAYLSLILGHLGAFPWLDLVCVYALGVSCVVKRKRVWTLGVEGVGVVVV